MSFLRAEELPESSLIWAGIISFNARKASTESCCKLWLEADIKVFRFKAHFSKLPVTFQARSYISKSKLIFKMVV